MNDDRLTGRHVIVTGGARGIGRGIARRAARAGADITIFDLDEDAVAQTIDEIADFGGRASFREVDVSDEDAVERGLENAVEDFGPVRGLVNNAGVQQQAPFLETTEDAFDAHFEVNTKGTFLCCRTVAQHMIDREVVGSIVNVVSTAGGRRPNVGQTAYGASKGGLIPLTIVMAKELGEHGITCNAISPGAVDTPMFREIFRDDIDEPDISREELIDRADDRHLVGRVGRPEDIGHIATLLLSEEGEWITGQEFVVDGGVVHR